MEKKIFDYSLNADEETLKQFKECVSQKFVVSAALMPDAHRGYVAPIGSVLITKGYVVPSWVGYDIGCGLIAIRIKGKNIYEKIKKNVDKIYNEVAKNIPLGVGNLNKESNISKKTKKSFEKLLGEFKEGPHDKNIFNFLRDVSLRHLGTLGGGNHFIELGFYKKEIWLIIHSGSRGIGYKVAKRYMIKASGSKEDYEKMFPLEVKSKLGKEYLNILNFGLEYALLNRLEISYKVIEILENTLNEELKTELWVNKNHNHAILEKGKYIHRKGATPSKKGERGIIPGNMRDGSFLVTGLGNAKFLNSSSHGAGRVLSRKEAKEKITMKSFRDEMVGIKGTISEKTLDESPRAYKNIEEIMKYQKNVKISKRILPIINWKG